MPRGQANSFGLKRFDKGRPLSEQITADRLNAILDAIDQNRIQYGPGVTGTRTPGGTTIRANRRSRPGTVSYFPFQILPSPYTGAGSPPGDQARRVIIRAGDVNNVVPSNINQERVIPANQTGYKIWIAFNISYDGDDNIIPGSLVLDSGASVPASSGSRPTTVYKEIGLVSTNSTSITSIMNTVRNSLWMTHVLTDYDCLERHQTIQWTNAG